jgi:hypothetical protein
MTYRIIHLGILDLTDRVPQKRGSESHELLGQSSNTDLDI